MESMDTLIEQGDTILYKFKEGRTKLFYSTIDKKSSSTVNFFRFRDSVTNEVKCLKYYSQLDEVSRVQNHNELFAFNITPGKCQRNGREITYISLIVSDRDHLEVIANKRHKEEIELMN